MRKSSLRNYIIVEKGSNRYLYGKVYGDIRFPNGHMILTTKIMELNEEETIAITENKTEYRLENKLSIDEFVKRVKEEYVDSKHQSFILSPLGEYA